MKFKRKTKDEASFSFKLTSEKFQYVSSFNSDHVQTTTKESFMKGLADSHKAEAS